MAKKEFGQEEAADKYMPDLEEQYIEQRIKDESTVSIRMKSDDQIRAGEEVSGKMYKYDLPVENEAITFKS